MLNANTLYLSTYISLVVNRISSLGARTVTSYFLHLQELKAKVKTLLYILRSINPL